MSDDAIKVLLIEDNPGDVRLIRELLKEAKGVSFSLECVDRLSTGLERLANGKSDAVLLDLGLPDSQGFDTFVKVRTQAPRMPIVILSGLADEVLAAQAVREGAQDYLIKGQVDSNLLRRSLRYAIERQQAEEALLQSEESFRALAENASDGIIITSADGGIVYANKQASEITGHTVDELLQTDIKKLAYPGRLQELLRRYKDRRKVKPVPSRYETVIVRKDGGIVPAEIAAATTTWQGKPTTMFFICDITERKRMQAQLMTQDRLASLVELVSGVAHELNNPLSSVIGFSELLLRRDLPDDIKEDLRIINDKAQLIARIVHNLLTFAQKQPQEKLPIDLNERIRRVLELRAYEQKTNNIQVITRFASDLPQIMGNGFQLYQVFFNIIINAEFFMIEAHNKGTLTITTERIGDFVRATFADDGPGISKENMTHLFTPFFTTKEVGKGTGLGLSICHGIIIEHGGRIYAGSELGKGATLIAELPITSSNESRIGR